MNLEENNLQTLNQQPQMQPQSQMQTQMQSQSVHPQQITSQQSIYQAQATPIVLPTPKKSFVWLIIISVISVIAIISVLILTI